MTIQIVPPQLKMEIETENPSYTGEPSEFALKPARTSKAGDDVVPGPYADPSAPLYFTLPPTIAPLQEPRESRRSVPTAGRAAIPDPA